MERGNLIQGRDLGLYKTEPEHLVSKNPDRITRVHELASQKLGSTRILYYQERYHRASGRAAPGFPGQRDSALSLS